jgi:hypothetical protein
MSEITGAELLRMIETADPTDTAKLDEIDARVWFIIQTDYDDIRFSRHDGGTTYYFADCGCEYPFSASWSCPQFTRSRDALKAIRPIGHTFRIEGVNDRRCGGDFVAELYDNTVDWSPDWIASARLPTEELAELHAIVQAIEYERRSG